MFRCEICGNVSQPRQPSFKIPVETRAVIYPKRSRVNACKKEFPRGRRFVRTDDPGGVGREAAREATACGECAERHRERRLAPRVRVVVDRDWSARRRA
jgi:hypothetical protein